MSTYYTGSDNQSDAAPMMYMRESSPGSYAEAPVLPGTMMMHMNSSSFAVNPQLQPSNCIEIQAVEASDLTSQQQEILSSLDGSRFAEHDFGAWRDGRNEMLSMHPMVGTANILHNGLNLQGQGLSLSLGTQMPFGIQMPSIPHRNPYSGFASFLIRNPSLPSRDEQSRNADYLPHGFAGANQDSYGMSGMSRTIPNSKYVKAAQELLNEVVNVPKAVTQDNWTKRYKEDGESKNVASTQQDSAQKNGLSHAERQELQSKLTKLLYMLDEVGRRYKQYNHQMQIVVSSFDVIAGCGAAKPYTAVALQTISRQFRCLKDAINDQIRATRKSLGDQDASENGKGVGITRLRYVEKQLRQQKALQQLGLMQPHAWRPQRGLPENSVSILRAWLFEHFLHPYPKDSEKIMLARQTGLTRSQVSNWFINARVRLWKPMVEEMYKEEFADLEMDSISSSENAVKARKGDTRTSKDRGEDLQQSGSSSTTERCSAGELVYSNSDCVLDVDIAGSTTRASFQYVTHGDAETDYGLLSQRTNQKPNADDSNIFPNAITHSDSTNAITYSDSASGRFTKAATASYHMKALGSFGSGSSISLSLGLQHCEEGSIPISGGSHQNFIAMKADDIYNPATSSVGAETTDIEYINPGTRQNSFGSSRMLHDFVA
ncbi:BEL1-like homeodomain protein 6 isoform X2 [Hibiscus syriacus]|uniref:BEL1-like homeodomain protein 6 isoform X2 n=1 Tax=Hibiscus syriacus TaxID=106335 RepID=UPI001922336E|nr:BEL1-like homeodomain protein 6 isoform X2 [Hibiscus syriacus]